jgi:Ca2+-binding RTX toxin-like protein
MAAVFAFTAFDMSNLDFSNLLYGTNYTGSSTTYQIDYASGYADVFAGTGFSYAADGTPVSGTVKNFAEFNGDSMVFSIDGMKQSAPALVYAAYTASLTDDSAIILDALKGNDSINGSDKADFLFAAGGKDVIRGNGGNDVILSGPGADKLYGGAGKDTFVFTDVLHSTAAKANQDTIFDLTKGDRIDLSYIDASTKSVGDQRFSYIGAKEFSGKAGELRYEKLKSDTYIYADVNGDKKADFTIHLDDPVSLSKAFFFL